MTIRIMPSCEPLQLDEHLERLQRLVADIESMKSGGLPDPFEIEGSAYIYDWVLDSRPVPCLRGYFEGHPGVRSGRMGVTSDLWVFAPEHGVARTLTRWYKLGPVGSGLEGRARQ